MGIERLAEYKIYSNLGIKQKSPNAHPMQKHMDILH